MSSIALPTPEEMKKHVLASLSAYWSKGSNHIVHLPVNVSNNPRIQLPLKLVSIELPHWATQCGIDGHILVPKEATIAGSTWDRVDWWLALYLLLECWHERMFEEQFGKPIHSYSNRLKNWDTRAWDYAWVNRIALFFRLWTEQIQESTQLELFGELPKPKFHLTHDVDAIKKTFPIRLKQCAFNIYNGVKNLCKLNFIGFLQNIRVAYRFLLTKGDWWTFDEILKQESAAGLHATFHFYSDNRNKTWLSWLMDPGYDTSSKIVRQLFETIQTAGGSIGLHPSFCAWKKPELIRAQREQLEADAKVSIQTCRQHWLRFSWSKTWAAQEQAGIVQDTTLMFNNRSGFRASAALSWNPWNTQKDTQHIILSVPTVLMDSHFYDYAERSMHEIKCELHHWIDECVAVNGEIALLWHPHTLSKDYDWKSGFDMLINAIQKAG
jgi:hypothetical protein